MSKKQAKISLSIVSLPLILGSMLFLASCGSDKTATDTSTPTTTETTATTTETPTTTETSAEDEGGSTPLTALLGNSERESTDPLELLENSQIKKELNITDEQSAEIKKLDEEFRAKLKEKVAGVKIEELKGDDAKIKAKYTEIDKESQSFREKIGKVLKPEQITRMKQIYLQIYGFGPLTSSDYSAELKLTDEQNSKIKTIQEDLFTNMKASWTTPTGSDDEKKQTIANNRKQMEQILKQSNDDTLAVLTDEQKKTLETLKGTEFKLDPTTLPSPVQQ
jgi:Spy/CpxP family protein refolding chaperone